VEPLTTVFEPLTVEPAEVEPWTVQEPPPQPVFVAKAADEAIASAARAMRDFFKVNSFRV
jgi:alkanesulfonate monooxygenase SsuD/methylene tetrahydromethanopterin reductase-like flavin-dependent oxidoreductase (luciferase family)